MCPSSASVIDARTNTPTAAYCAAGTFINARITNTGIIRIRSIESLFGKFIYGNTFPVRSYASAPVISACTYIPGVSSRSDSSQITPSLSGASLSDLP